MYLKALGVLIVVLVLAAGVVYAFGTPTTPAPTGEFTGQPVLKESGMPGAGSGAPVEGTVTQVPEGGVPEPDENTPLAIQIPGCTCHSDDPKLVEQHAEYRMNQCAGCHGGQTPTGQ